jgi:hypothetical protein
VKPLTIAGTICDVVIALANVPSPYTVTGPIDPLGMSSAEVVRWIANARDPQPAPPWRNMNRHDRRAKAARERRQWR